MAGCRLWPEWRRGRCAGHDGRCSCSLRPFGPASKPDHCRPPRSGWPMVGACARGLLGWSHACACCVFTPPSLSDQALEAGGRGGSEHWWRWGLPTPAGSSGSAGKWGTRLWRENRRFAEAGVLSRSPARQGAPLRVGALLRASPLPLGRAAGLASLCWGRLDAPVRREPCTLQSSEVWLAGLVSWGSWWEPL